METSALTADGIKRTAAALGFDLCGIAPATRHAKLTRLSTWIAAGFAGDMKYLGDSLTERLDPASLLPTARSVISLGCVYNTTEPPSTELPAGRAAIARYAWGDDYHVVLTGRVRQLLAWMAAQAGPGLEALSSVDNGPVQERVFAEQAGLGWIGKNTCVINPELGSWLFLAAIVTNAGLDVDTPTADQCGTCTRCIDACPTGAIVEPYTVDATRCLSYLTIESRTEVAPVLRPAVHPQVFGCDVCQDVCPWNRRAAVSDDPAWAPRPAFRMPLLVALCTMSDAEWSASLKGSAMKRAGLRRLRRSLALAASHLPWAEAVRALDALASQPSSSHPDVSEAIRWSRAALEASPT